MEIKALATVLVFVTVFENGATLYCRNCLSSKSFDECEKMGDIVQCNSTIVNQNHENFKNYNPGLEQGNWTDFKCYRIQRMEQPTERNQLRNMFNRQL
ncbi:uncharacterized protein LOC128727256 isoform X2 [Anopheles nili]|uniref:uncharacterized protein LOC128727256 isoform X2 n=1 Tax=Anopheles nili TaxID=185578 RepID=UPI00237B03F9|nr:uncharacterized protein LOC128727256 isoform X2 [Anopheles nili]